MKIKIITKKVDDLIPYVNNARTHSEEQVSQIASSIKEFGFNNPILLDGDNGVVAGHGRLLAAKKLGMEEVPCIELAHLSGAKKRAYILADNKLALNAGWDYNLLNIELESLMKEDMDLNVIGFSDEELNEILNNAGEILNSQENSNNGEENYPDPEQKGSLQERFVVPPFSVLDTRQGYWNERKEYWKQMIGDNGESRENLLSSAALMSKINNGVSILDPVLAEIICRWFGFENCKCFDCFAGDTVFGFVAAKLGYSFTGKELREEQAKLNNERTKKLKAKYINDDGQNVLKHIEKNSQDLFFSCPPYYNLEVYSDKLNDASNQETYEDFISILDNAFSNSLKCLKNNRFAVVVVGDIRDKKGFYYGFCDDIKRIFKKNGVGLYNEAILVEPIGTLPQRVGKYMNQRKLGKCHQNVLIFYKGDSKAIKGNYPILEIEENPNNQINNK